MCFFCDFWIGVLKLTFAVPGYFAFGNNLFSKDDGFVIFPSNGIQKNVVKMVGFFFRKYPSEVIYNTIPRQKIALAIHFKFEQFHNKANNKQQMTNSK